MLGEISSKSLGLWAGLGTAAFLGYCIYFDRWVCNTLLVFGNLDVGGQYFASMGVQIVLVIGCRLATFC